MTDVNEIVTLRQENEHLKEKVDQLTAQINGTNQITQELFNGYLQSKIRIAYLEEHIKKLRDAKPLDESTNIKKDKKPRKKRKSSNIEMNTTHHQEEQKTIN